MVSVVSHYYFIVTELFSTSPDLRQGLGRGNRKRPDYSAATLAHSIGRQAVRREATVRVIELRTSTLANMSRPSIDVMWQELTLLPHHSGMVALGRLMPNMMTVEQI